MSHTMGIVFLGCSRISVLWGWVGAQGTASRAPVDCGCPTARTPYHEHAPPRARPTMSTPKDHQSALCVWPLRFTTSGAMYSIVPQKE